MNESANKCYVMMCAIIQMSVSYEDLNDIETQLDTLKNMVENQKAVLKKKGSKDEE